ncbi:hypothetical protein L0B52_02860 [Suttonella sp. R2A3]|uniref:imelysin family protein n=1 Tax=Suttonella sp. R2A3 TaxID=2908648 RepID=UPI001F1BA7DC|nr:imelysin family protein [Suttonella sp. R2A3]UJF25101.1 hypothetical protein L0B52_02860 [Suttonella sp. R2A3]
MKPILLALTLVCSSLIHAESYSDDEALAGIYDQVLKTNAAQAIGACSSLQEALGGGIEGLPYETAFSELVVAWKQVEATYMLGSIDVAAIDFPTYIDMFHMGNEDINQSLARALDGDSEPKTALFKNAYKTIGALEYLLYQEAKSPRQLAFAQVATDNLCRRFGDIAQVLDDAQGDYMNNPDKSTALLLNALVESVYKTREWRVGDPAGLSRKYGGSPDPARAEYRLSGQSLPAIRAILATHQQMIGEDAQPNLATIAYNHGADEAIALAQGDLLTAIAAAEVMEVGEDLTPENAQALFDAMSALQTDYYQHLVKSLDVVAKILDADGD